MEDITFEFTVRGTIRAYNEEHALDELKELVREMCGYTGLRNTVDTVKVGTMVAPGYVSTYLMQKHISEKIFPLLKDMIHTVLEDCSKDLPEPPLLFDRTDYNTVRRCIRKKFDYYLTPTETLFGTYKPDGTNDIMQYASNIADACTEQCIEELDIPGIQFTK
jgi:hypothetical protein